MTLYFVFYARTLKKKILFHFCFFYLIYFIIQNLISFICIFSNNYSIINENCNTYLYCKIGVYFNFLYICLCSCGPMSYCSFFHISICSHSDSVQFSMILIFLIFLSFFSLSLIFYIYVILILLPYFYLLT